MGEIVRILEDDDEIFFQDESTFCQSGIPHRTWAVKGTKPILPIYGTYSKLNVFGIINPISGKSHFQYINNAFFYLYQHKIESEFHYSYPRLFQNLQRQP